MRLIRSPGTATNYKPLNFYNVLQKRQFLVNNTGGKLWGYLYVPEGVSNIALFTHAHGVGRRGGTEAGVEAMLGESPLELLAEGENFIFDHPITKEKWGFAILCLQDPSWSPSDTKMHYAILNDVLKAFPSINQNAIFVGGLSAGGDSTLDSITNPATLGLYAAAAPMSPASTGNMQYLAQTVAAGIRAWGFSGNQDGGYTQNMVTFDAAMNERKAGTCRTQIYDGGHGNWVQFFRRTYRDNDWGNPNGGDGKMNLWEFLLCCMKGSSWVPPPPPSTGVVASLVLPSATLQADGSYLVTTDSVAVDASASENVTSAWDGYHWGLQIIEPGTWNAGWAKATGDEGGAYGPAKRTLIGLKDGLYGVSVTVKSLVNGKTATKAITMRVKIGVVTQVEPTVMAYDPVDNKIYFSDLTTTGLQSARIDISKREVSLISTSGKLYKIAL